MNVDQNSVFLSVEMMAWITTIEIPILTTIIAYAHRAKHHMDNRITHLHDTMDESTSAIQADLMGYKLEVAQKYASVAYLRDVESRLTNHLIRIEKKLDGKYHG